jgi:hypothetical protein
VAETGLPFRYAIVLFEDFQYETPDHETSEQFATLTEVFEDFPVLSDHEGRLSEVVEEWSGIPHVRVVLSPEMAILDVHVSLAEEEDAKAFALIREHAGI